MDTDALIREICARVQEKIAQAESRSEGLSKPKLLILTQDHGTICHEMLECRKLSEHYETQCARMMDYDCDVTTYEAVIAFTLNNEALGKIAHGIFDSGYTRLFGQALLAGKKIFIVKEDVELFQSADVAPPAYYQALAGNLKLLTDSGAVIADRGQIAEQLLGAEALPVPEMSCCQAEQETGKEAALEKKIITEKDMIALRNEQVKRVQIREKAILTDLAKEYAARHKMVILRRGLS